MREKKTRLSISGSRRPYRSAMSPKMNAPTGRKARVVLSVAAMVASLTANSFPIAVSVNTPRKKSRPSSVQPRKLARTAAWGEPRLVVKGSGGRGEGGGAGGGNNASGGGGALSSPGAG